MGRITNLSSSALLLVSLSLSGGCAKPYNAASQSAASPQATSQAVVAQQTPPAPVEAATPNLENLMPRTRADDAINSFKANDAVIIDVRGTPAYDGEHIEGALDFPLDRIEKGDFKGLPRDKHIIAYCT